MGSTNFYHKITASSMAEGFNELQDRAREEYGDDIYNGQINNCQGFKDVTAEYKKSKKPLDKFIADRMDNLSKFVPGEGICVSEPKENTNKIKSKVNNYVVKGTKKWTLYYEVNPQRAYQLADFRPKKFRKKGDAVDFARKQAEKTKRAFTIKMVKELENGEPLVATVEYKPSKSERPGTYIFYGYVSY